MTSSSGSPSHNTLIFPRQAYEGGGGGGRGKCLSVCFGRGFVHEVLGAGLTSFVNRMFDNDGDEGLHFDPKLLFCQH